VKKFSEAKAFVAHLLRARTAREEEWRELADWIAPHRGVFGGEDLAPVGHRRNKKAFVQIASQALLRGASGMTSGMTPRNISWFEPDFGERELAEASGARSWLDEVDRRMKECLADGGFYQAVQSFNMDLLWAGCALMYVETARQTPLRFECVPIGSYAVGLDGEGRLDAVCRTMIWTPARLASVFGRDALSEGSRTKLERQPYESVRVTHLVRRRDWRYPGRQDRQNMAWQSLFWESEGAEDFLHEGGYHEMPYFFTVWHESGTPYGTGPGDDALADSRQVDLMERRKLEGLGLLTRPPVQAPPELKGKVDLSPGGITYVSERVKIEPIYDLGPWAQAFQYLQAEIQTVGQRLENQLMASIFASMPLDQRPRDMSATEFLERKREALQQLGPVISAYEPHVLTPLLHRVAACMDRAGLLPVPPDSLAGLPLLVKMNFVSPLANALRQTGAETTRALLQEVAFLAQLQPEVLDKVDVDQAVDELATGTGAPGGIVRADADVQALRQARAEAQAQAQQTMMEQQALQTAVGAARGMADTARIMHDMKEPVHE